MPTERKPTVRCAIYTRKSSEEGLEQSFNSLHAQREACQAYITSQRHEGWHTIGTHYDDGGYSGGSMERPALKRLLDDIDAGKVDTVVVYKVDRLTRSLADFAKIIERFDERSVSFVSVTQQFNTTTSMGRLTLNVLLSFAQFEREVTGERIRDKIAASKKKGMWMGGTVPLGYDVKDHHLIVNPKEAERVREIFRCYLELGSVRKLKMELDRRGVRTKRRTTSSGRKLGGGPFFRGALYTILQNRTYIGEIEHRDQSYAGEHEAIVPQELWDRVQNLLRENNQAQRNGSRAAHSSLLAGILYDAEGSRFTPSHAVKNGKRYRYYVSQAVIQHRANENNHPTRIPAYEIEHLACSSLKEFLASAQQVVEVLGDASDNVSITKALVGAAQRRSKAWGVAPPSEVRSFLRAVLARTIAHENRVDLQISKPGMRDALLDAGTTSKKAVTPPSNKIRNELFTLSVDAHLKKCGGEVRLVLTSASAAIRGQAMPSLIKAVTRARDWYDGLLNGRFTDKRSIAKAAGVTDRYVSRILQCAFLAPDIVDLILAGKQSPDLTLDRLLSDLPLDWAAQRKRLGISCQSVQSGMGDPAVLRA